MIKTMFKIADKFVYDKEVIAIKHVMITHNKIIYLVTCKEEENIINHFLIEGSKNDEDDFTGVKDMLKEYTIRDCIHTQEGDISLKENGICYRAYEVSPI